MNITSKTEHKSKIEADAVYTSYEWSLSNWSLLIEHYSKEVESPEFTIMPDKEHTCILYMRSGANGTTVSVEIPKSFNSNSLLATISLVDKNMKKLKTVKSRRLLGTHMSEEEQYFYLDFENIFSLTSADQYLQDDTLILFFELYVVKAIKKSPIITNNWNSNISTIAHDKFKDMFETKKFCDVNLIVEDQTLPAHKLILAACSDVFQAMFTTKMKEQNDNTVTIDDVDAQVFKTFLKYIYTGKVEDIDKVVTELIVVADKYQVIPLVELCETYMATHLQVDNATQYLLAAHRQARLHLEKEAVEFIKRNTQILADPDNYKLLFDYPTLITRIFG